MIRHGCRQKPCKARPNVFTTLTYHNKYSRDHQYSISSAWCTVWQGWMYYFVISICLQTFTKFQSNKWWFEYSGQGKCGRAQFTAATKIMYDMRTCLELEYTYKTKLRCYFGFSAFRSTCGSMSCKEIFELNWWCIAFLGLSSSKNLPTTLKFIFAIGAINFPITFWRRRNTRFIPTSELIWLASSCGQRSKDHVTGNTIYMWIERLWRPTFVVVGLFGLSKKWISQWSGVVAEW